jgi:hypothetical protein
MIMQKEVNMSKFHNSKEKLMTKFLHIRIKFKKTKMVHNPTLCNEGIDREAWIGSTPTSSMSIGMG